MKKTVFFSLAALMFPMIAFAAVEEAPAGADIVATIIDYLPESLTGVVTLIISICAAISAFWSRPADDANKVVRIIYAVVNAIGFNMGKAANADDAAAKGK